MAEAQGIRMKNPAHPGGFVKGEVIEALELSVTGAARTLGVTRAALSAVLNERARLSPEMALRIKKAFGVSMDTLMWMQNSYDIRADPHEGGRVRGRSFRELGQLIPPGAPAIRHKCQERVPRRGPA